VGIPKHAMKQNCNKLFAEN
jgi:hypothetical protein